MMNVARGKRPPTAGSSYLMLKPTCCDEFISHASDAHNMVAVIGELCSRNSLHYVAIDSESMSSARASASASSSTDATTLADEYYRDCSGGLSTAIPRNYFPDDDPERAPINNWRPFAFLLISNWINDLYQRTPYELINITSLNR